MTEASAAVPARVHLAGNPSDGYGGAVLSSTVPGLTASVTVSPADAFSIAGPVERWPTMSTLVDHTQRLGYAGGDRLVRAALITLDEHLGRRADRRPGRFEWSTTIPRSVGLGGSSALVIAAMRAAIIWWEIDDAPEGVDLARVALEAETVALGIAAGLADRAVQVLGGTILTDCRQEPTATAVPAAPIRLRLLWHESAAAPSGEYHARLRAAVERGDPATIEGLQHLAELAVRAAAALTAGDVDGLSRMLDESLDARCRLGHVPDAALEGVEELRHLGASVNFAGSGGTLVVLGPAVTPAGWNGMELPLP